VQTEILTVLGMLPDVAHEEAVSTLTQLSFAKAQLHLCCTPTECRMPSARVSGSLARRVRSAIPPGGATQFDDIATLAVKRLGM
jgi:hypothetical protein